MPKVDLREQRRVERAARKKRNTLIAIVTSVGILAIIAIVIIQNLPNQVNADEVDTIFQLSEDAVKASSGLIYDPLVEGEGPAARVGDTVSIIYTGYLPNGQIFDSNVETGDYYQFVLGRGDVIAGWDEGIEGMQVGGARLVIIPPDLATGAIDPFQVIPENTTLTYSITLKEIK
jgi:FKBP-type peptidyl-prolyl cis-trans isomerase FkpA